MPLNSTWAGVRHRLGRVRRAPVAALQRFDPSRLALAPTPSAGGVAVVGVYRHANRATVARLIDGCPDEWVVRLWSLDDVVPDHLAPVTAGTGPGTRFALLNRLIGSLPAAASRYTLVLVDDDVDVVIGDLPRLVEAGSRLGFDLYQPGHVATSTGSWTFVRRRPLCFARETDFVEQGPLVALSTRARDVLVPLPEDLGMAWGIEARWWRACRAAGLRQGIVDAVAVRHRGRVAAQYDRDAQERLLARELAEAGLSDLRELQREVGRTGVRAAWRSRPDRVAAS
jgi:hypothetical protein